MDIFAVNNFGDTRSGGLAGPMGLFVIVLMAIATVLLIRNMNKRLRRLPDSFPAQETPRRGSGIARSDVGPHRPDVARGRPEVDDDRSPSVKEVTETEVRGDDGGEVPDTEGDAAGRS